MFSKRELEGYVMIDHRESPGLDHPLLGKGTLFQAPTYNCSHCQRLVIINPKRNRERANCTKCDHIICDECGTNMRLTGICRPFKQIVDEWWDRVSKQTTPAPSVIIRP